ncbi:pyridoxal phosphate-dependent aminotransferase [Psychromicrobium lacuslunae]|uniref:Aspartate aminotransferase n=1 Tax=Psychromicrobium lacuslunae TaxID=1618207 RepID=A0A0D4BWR2_9MICC|nr:pyridoxal phosphate-dependent aminotransferase [Psychromicrobium lacuslunae]AJT40550.1 aspartate aminotransferase [Psychromicrobium lacuslunae]
MALDAVPPLAQHVLNLPSNQIREITEAAWTRPDSLVLSIGEPGFEVPQHVRQAAIDSLLRDETNYTPNGGIWPLREAFAERLAKQQGVQVDPRRIFVTAGAQQGLHLALSLLLSPGDEILIPNPGYPTFAMTSRLLHAVPIGYPLRDEHAFQPQVADIEALITPRTKVLLLNSPSNPLGAVLSAELTEELVALARKHNLWVVSDECYEAFTFDLPHVSPVQFDTDGRVLLCWTASKTYGLTGIRIGALLTPPGMQVAVSNAVESSFSCVSTPAQYAALAALTGPQDYVAQAKAHYRNNRDVAEAQLRAQGLHFLNAKGAFYLWVDVSHLSNGDVRSWVHGFLASDGVALAPGTAFGSQGEGWARIALCGDTSDLLAGISRIPGP